jgi:hypothetical protein
MIITKEFLAEKRACSDGVKWFLAQQKTKDIHVLNSLIQAKKWDWANWLIVRVMTYKQYVSYAVYAAEQVIDIYEKRYPEDKRPRAAIEAARKCIKDPSDSNKQAAADAAYAAYAAAADAAYAATYAAYAAYAPAAADADAAAATYAAAADADADAYAAYASAAAARKKALRSMAALVRKAIPYKMIAAALKVSR